MAKTSSIEKNNRRKKLAKQFAGKRAKLKLITTDQKDRTTKISVQLPSASLARR